MTEQLSILQQYIVRVGVPWSGEPGEVECSGQPMRPVQGVRIGTWSIGPEQIRKKIILRNTNQDGTFQIHTHTLYSGKDTDVKQLKLWL